MFEGKVLPWEEVLPKLHFEPLTEVFTGQYSKVGFVNYGVYDWTEFEPFYIEKQLPPPWGNRYLCEVCSWIIDKPRIKGDHTFLRLKTPNGEWYSVGQYEPLKGHDQYHFPMSLKPSRFMSPDVSEYWNGHFTTLAFEITPEQFGLMKQKIEDDKRQQLYPYQVYQSNCTIWAKSIAEVAGLNLPSSLAAADLLTPNLAAFGRKINRLGLTPGWLKQLVKFIFAVTLNFLSLILGSGMVHPNFKSDPNFNSSVPYIHSLKDLFDVDKVISEHPFVLGNYVRNQVEEWRRSKRQGLMNAKEELTSNLSSITEPGQGPLQGSLQAQLDEIELSLDSIQYAIPPEFKSS